MAGVSFFKPRHQIEKFNVLLILFLILAIST